jgi:SPP1 family predicted phage head-tail adaptor
MKAGELDERITIKRRTESKNEYATLTETPTTVATVWARVRPETVQEEQASQQTEARATYRILIRRRTDLTEDDWIEWRGDDYDIRGIKDWGPREDKIMIKAERGVAVQST